MLLDLLFPKFCLGCGHWGVYICLNCEKKLTYIDYDICIYCRQRSLYGFTHPKCKRLDGLDGVLSIFHYNNMFKGIIKTIKYRGTESVFEELTRLIEPSALFKLKTLKINTNIYIQPTPLHRHKLNERGFNQAVLISNYFASLLSIEISNVLERVKYTPSQANIMNRHERLKNVSQAFKTKENVNNTSIILVDDVFTSGATLREATKTLKRAGANKVFGLTLARG